MCRRFSYSSSLLSVVLVSTLVGSGGCGSGPAYQGMSAEQVWARAQAEVEEEDWGGATEWLDRFILMFPTHPRVADARYQAAEAYYADEKYITAQQVYGDFINRHPADPRVPRAALGVCESLVQLSPISQRDQTETEEAAQVCRNVERDYTGIADEVAGQARAHFNAMRAKLGKKAYENASYYAEREWRDPAIIYFEKVVDEYGDTEWAPKAILGLIEQYRALGYQEEIEEWRQRLLNSYPDSPEARSIAANADGNGAAG